MAHTDLIGDVVMTWVWKLKGFGAGEEASSPRSESASSMSFSMRRGKGWRKAEAPALGWRKAPFGQWAAAACCGRGG